MLRASGMAAEVDLEAVPLLPGVSDLLVAGIESTLSPANRDAEAEIENRRAMVAPAAYAALFDPQTSGGLLLGIDAARVAPLLADIDGAGHQGAVIGEVVAHNADRRLRLR